MSEPIIWIQMAMIADDLHRLSQSIAAKIDDIERLHLDNLILRLDNVIDHLPQAIHQQIMHWRTQQQEGQR